MIAALLGLSLLLPGCQQTSDPRYRDTLELLGFNGDGVLLDARVSWGNTGLLAGQAEVICDLIERRAAPVHYRQVAMPERSSHGDDGVVAAADSLVQEGDEWRLTITSDALSARLRLTPTLAGEPAPAGAPWAVEAPAMGGRLRGHWQAGSQGGLVDGRGVLLRGRGVGGPALSGTSRLGIFVLGDDVSIGIDQSGAQLTAWALAADLLLPTDDVVVTHTQKGYRVDLRPAVELIVQIKTRSQRLRSFPMEHLTRPERWLLKALVGRPVRTTRAATARILTAGDPASYPALVVTETWR